MVRAQGVRGITGGQMEIGDGNVDRTVPAGVGVLIDLVEKGDGNAYVDAQFTKEENTIVSKDYFSLSNKVNLSIKMGDGNINIKSK